MGFVPVRSHIRIRCPILPFFTTISLTLHPFTMRKRSSTFTLQDVFPHLGIPTHAKIVPNTIVWNSEIAKVAGRQNVPVEPTRKKRKYVRRKKRLRFTKFRDISEAVVAFSKSERETRRLRRDVQKLQRDSHASVANYERSMAK